MILDRLVLHNFCLFKGRQVLELAPETRDRCVVLVGGMNGGGKTTILDAVQLALYGSRAQVSKREGIPYETFLRNCINRGVDPTDGASVELQFRYVSEGEQNLYEVRRCWSLKKSNVRESVTVHRDGKPDRHLSDHWSDIVEELIPLGISRLFFFDAEQVRFLADDESSHAALGSAVKSLLGLDLAEKLIADTSILENRLSSRLASLSDDPNYKALLDESAELAIQVKVKQQQVAALENDRLRAIAAETAAEEEFKQLGGPHWLDREARRQELAQTQQNERQLKEELVRIAGTELPLALVPELIDRTIAQDKKEQEARESKVIARTLAERDSKILQVLKKEGAERSALSLIKKVQDRDRQARSKLALTPLRHGLSDRSRVAIEKLSEDLQNESSQEHLVDLLSRLEHAQATREQLERSLEMAPEEASVTEVFEKFKRATEVATRINAESLSLKNELETLVKLRADVEA
ncbi:MAG: DNA sulfur modification protein DndD, partial [Pirellulaceae bacterium]